MSDEIVDGAGTLPVVDPAAGTASEAFVGDLARPDGDAEKVLGELAIAAAGIGTFDYEVTTGRLRWDARLIELFGYAPDDFDGTFEAFTRRVHPDDRPRVLRALDDAVEAGGEYEAEYRVCLPGGQTRWLAAKGRALADEAGTVVRVLGAALDTTELQESEARVVRVLESMPAAFFSVDRSWRFSYVSSEGERVLGRPKHELLGKDLWAEYPSAVGSPFEDHYRHAMATGEPVTFDAYYPVPLDAWYEVRGWPGPDGLSVYFLDITARRDAQDRAERAAARAALVARVTTAVTETLEAEEAVARLAQLVVPALGDWCIVTLIDDGEHAGARRGLRDVGSWHVDAEGRDLAQRYAEVRLDALHDASFLGRALATGETVVIESGATPRIAAVLRPGEARDLLHRLAPESAGVFPLRGRGRTVGLLSVFRSAHRGPLNAGDVATAQEVAGRAGLALDNSRLFRQQRTLAEGLQRSLLTEPPEPDHVEVVVRYEPAAEAAQIGGDWYDAFLQRDGATVVVIGDVVGHDITAAGAMGQVRSLLRGIAVATGAGPAELLRQVDQAIRTLQAETIATAVVARVEQHPEERSSGVTRVRWSNAGHPPPMVIHANGTVAALSPNHADLLLGVRPEASRVESEIVLERDATLFLYTDGLVERRGENIRDGIARLRTTLESLAHVELNRLCDEVLARMLPSEPEDDVALVAVRLHPQDLPRPREAGPRRVPPDVPVHPEDRA